MTARRVSLILVAAALVFALTGCGIADTIRDKIQYDNGILGGGSGMSSAGNMEVAVRLTPFVLGPYNGRQIMGVEFYNNAAGPRGVTVRLYPAGTELAPGSPALI